MSDSVQYAQRKGPSAEDAGNLRLLAICHIAFGAISILLGVLVAMSILTDPASRALVVGLLAADLLCVLSGICMYVVRLRIFSLVVGAITCAIFPMGTIMGVWALIVLCRPGVVELYKFAKG